jgi:hypothetical protein
MATLTIHELPEGVLRRLEQRARQNRRTVEEEVRAILETVGPELSGGAQDEGTSQPEASGAGDARRYPLRGTPYRYDRPTDPVAEEDWESLR